MVRVTFMRLFAGRFYPIPLEIRWPNSFALLLFQMSAYGTFRSFRRDCCFAESAGLTMRAKIWCEYIYSMTVRGRNCVDNW